MRPDTIVNNGDKNTLIQLLMRRFSGVYVDSSIQAPSSTSVQKRSLLNESPNMTALVLKNAKVISSQTINDRSYIKIVDLYKATTLVTNRTFYCSRLRAIFLRNSSVVSNATATGSAACLYQMHSNLKVLVPRSLIESYQTATNWATLYASYPDMFGAVEDYTEDGTLEGDFDAEKLGIEI
jgi:hypothetical protein